MVEFLLHHCLCLRESLLIDHLQCLAYTLLSLINNYNEEDKSSAESLYNGSSTVVRFMLFPSNALNALNFLIILTWFISLRNTMNSFRLSFWNKSQINQLCQAAGETQCMKQKETLWVLLHIPIGFPGLSLIFSHTSLGFRGQANSLDQILAKGDTKKPKYYFTEIQYVGTRMTVISWPPSMLYTTHQATAASM